MSSVIFGTPPPAAPPPLAPPPSSPPWAPPSESSDDSSSGTRWWLPIAIAVPAAAVFLLGVVVALSIRYKFLERRLPQLRATAERSIRRLSNRGNFADVQAGVTGTEVDEYRASLDALPAVPSSPSLGRVDSGSPLDLAMASREPLRVKETYVEHAHVAGMLCRAVGGTRGRPEVRIRLHARLHVCVAACLCV